MNIILVSQSTSRARSMRVSRGMIWGGVTGVVLVLALTAFAGFRAADQNGAPQLVSEIERLQALLDVQEQELVEARGEAAHHLDALALRVGALQARVARLDALGQRLTQLGELDTAEFDFGTIPGVGGPAEPLDGVTNSGIDILADLDALEGRLGDSRLQLSALENLIAGRDLSERFVPAGRPVNSGYISSFYGTRSDPFTGQQSRHYGVDFTGVDGADVLSVADGVVTWVGPRVGYGETVDIDHGNGFVTRYAHNQENLVDVGQRVRAGDVIALMGRSGRTTGPNVHFEVFKDGRRVDPIKFIRGQHQG